MPLQAKLETRLIVTENVRWKFTRKGSVVPSIKDVQNALIEAVEADLIIWYDDVELPGIRDTMEPPHPRPLKPTLATSAPTGLRFGRHFVEAPVKQDSKVQALPSQATKAQDSPSTVSKTAAPKAVAPVSKTAEATPTKTTDPKQCIAKLPQSIHPATTVRVAEPAAKDFKIHGISKSKPPTTESSQQPLLKAKAGELQPHQKMQTQSDQAETALHSASAKTPRPLSSLAGPEGKSKPAPGQPSKEKVNAEIDLLLFDDPCLPDFFAVLRPDTTVQHASPTSTTSIHLLPPPPIPWASKPKSASQSIQENRPQIVAQPTDSQNLPKPTLPSPQGAGMANEPADDRETALKLPVCGPQAHAEKVTHSVIEVKESLDKSIQPQSRTRCSMMNSRWAVKPTFLEADLAGPRPIELEATGPNLFASPLENRKPSHESPSLQNRNPSSNMSAKFAADSSTAKPIPAKPKIRSILTPY